MNKMKIAWLFPDTLYLHGERGNILALQRFARLAGFEPEVTKIDFETQDFDPMTYDIIFCPPGEIVSFPVILQWLAPYRQALEAYIEAGKPLLVTGTSIGLWGLQVTREDGSTFEGLGLIKVLTKENKSVYGDDLYFTCEYNNESMEIIGNQIQMADFQTEEEAAFGMLSYGYGNTGKDRMEGFQRKNSIFTNTLGPMLVTNPRLAIEIVKVAAACKGVACGALDFDMTLEEKSFATKKEFILTKESRLTNCKE